MHLNELQAMAGTLRTGITTTVVGLTMAGSAAAMKWIDDAHSVATHIVATAPAVGLNISLADLLGALGTIGAMAGAAITWTMARRNEAARNSIENERAKRDMEREASQKDFEARISQVLAQIHVAHERLELKHATDELAHQEQAKADVAAVQAKTE